MAAAPAEDLTPDLAPVKRRKKDPGCLETSPVLPATAAAGWSSLPDDLVRRIADSFLATNDLDRYMYFRAVCPSWRAATDDPRNNTTDDRFLPRRWIVLDDVFQSEGNLLLLNTDTGRFLRKKLPLLREYYVVATTPSGFFVLADRSPPHAARLFNPLTGVLTRFVAPVPLEARVAYVGCTKDDSLAIVLLGDSSTNIYQAIPDSESFSAKDYQQGAYNIFRKAVVGGAYLHISNGPAFGAALAELIDFLMSLHVDPVKFFSSDYPGDVNHIQGFVVDLAAAHMLVVMYGRPPFVLDMNTKTGKVHTVESINRFAIFIGHQRCLAVDTSKFPGIEANCMYYTEPLGSSARICKYNLKDRKEEIISETAEFLKQDKQFVLVADRPFTIIHLLCSYTINIPDSQLALQKMS